MNSRTGSIVRKLTMSLAAVCIAAAISEAQQPAQQSGQAAAPKTVPTPGIPSTAFAGLDQYRASRIAMFTDDYGQLARYRTANEELRSAVPFPSKPYVNRGIGGQTTPQMLVRFRQDVIELHPKAVVILAGTNDIAGNTGPMRLEDIEADLASMADLAKAHGIPVVFSSVLPVHNYTPKAQRKRDRLPGLFFGAGG